MKFVDIKIAEVNSSPTENTIEKYLRMRCMAYGALVLKLGTKYRGFPDRMVLWRNPLGKPRVDFVELKRPKGGKEEKLQNRWHRKLESMGYDAFRFKTKADVDKYVFRYAIGKPINKASNAISLGGHR